MTRTVRTSNNRWQNWVRDITTEDRKFTAAEIMVMCLTFQIHTNCGVAIFRWGRTTDMRMADGESGRRADRAKIGRRRLVSESVEGNA